MLSLLIFILILSILIVVHEFGHFMMARKMGVRVENFSLGFGPQLFKKKKGNTEYSISAIPLGGFVKLSGDNLEEFKGKPYEYYSKAPGKRFWIIFFGPLLNYVLGFLFFWLILFAGYPTLTTKVGGLVEGLGAIEAGLKPQDKIVSIDGKTVGFWEDLQKEIQEKKDSSKVSLSVLREGKEFPLEVKLTQREFQDPLGQKHTFAVIGITPADEVVKVRHSAVKSLFLSFQKTRDLTVMTYKGLWLMLTGKLSMRESVTGPLGIFYITSKAASLGLIAVLHLLAVLSISLAIFNLLPLPILDGGHILFLLIEKIRGKPLSLKTEGIVTRIGLTFIILLAVMVTYNDIARHFGEKISQFFTK